ncbi:hypothetical protein PVAND_006924 [Polypedilum vanderplanki]|uniref:Uncharacterized protein n=1 Tax=Polypedilum vanderplanki TaxID=319348 RepID=A0A9J6C6B2_POLVA|nr:hypothetical protein PVAND_006924 [Polypedilum vanderplanki]
MIKRLQSLQSRGIKSVYKLDHQYPTLELFKRYAPNTLPVLGIIYFVDTHIAEESLERTSTYIGPKLYNQLPQDELDESLDSIELIKGFKRKGMLSICGIIRVFDYGKQIKDSSIILLIASKDEYQSLVNQKIVRIMGLRFKIIGHDLVMKTVISTKINAPVPDNLYYF